MEKHNRSRKGDKFYISKPHDAPFKLTDGSTIHDIGWEHKTSLPNDLKRFAGIFLQKSEIKK